MSVKNEDGVSELVDETLIIALVVVCACIAGVVFLGFVIPVGKTAYIVPEFGTEDIGGTTVIRVYDRGGDPVSFTEKGPGKYGVAFFVDTEMGSFRAVREETLTSLQPGQKVYLYYDGKGFVITNDLAGSPVVDLPSGGIVVRIVDTTANVLIAKGVIVEGAVTTGTITTTVTPGVNTTTSATPATTAPATVTATPVPTTPIPAVTTPASLYGILVSWLPKGTGANAEGTVTPPATNDVSVIVPAGSDQTFTLRPSTDCRVRTVSLDGVQISSGGTTNQVIMVTIPNVQANHTLTVHFASK